MKVKHILKIVIFNMLIVVIFFLTLEVIQRVRWYFKSDGSTYWLFYGFVSKPADYAGQLWRIAEKKKLKKKPRSKNRVYEIQVFEKLFPNGIRKHNPDCSGQKGQINSLGFRSEEFTPEKPAGIYRIIATGGSTTAGYESDIKHTWPALLQKKLNSGIAGEKSFEVINAGKGAESMGYTTHLLQEELVRYAPDMAMVYLTFNHLHLHRASVNVPRDFHYRVFQFKQWLSDKSLFFLTLREKLTSVFHLEGYVIGDIYIPINTPKKLADAFLQTPKVFKDYEKYLQDFADICKAHNITAVFITEACVLSGNSYLLLGEDMAVIYERMYGIMREVARKNDVIFIDAAKSIQDISGHEKLFTDGLHLYPEGNDVLAGLIYTRLKKEIKEGT